MMTKMAPILLSIIFSPNRRHPLITKLARTLSKIPYRSLASLEQKGNLQNITDMMLFMQVPSNLRVCSKLVVTLEAEPFPSMHCHLVLEPLVARGEEF